MTEKIRKIVTVILGTVFIVSTVLLIGRCFDLAESADSNQAAEELAARPRETLTAEPSPTEPEAAASDGSAPTEPPVVWVAAPVEEDEHMKKLKEINLDALREKNPNVVGWVFVPNCKINYPIVQGEDNEHYLDYTWDNRRSIAGAIFIESTNAPDFSDFRTIVYGHNMADSSMFGSLHRFEKKAYWEQNPYVYLVTDEGVFRYEIYSSYRADVESDTYVLNLTDEARKAAFIKLTKDEALYDTGITPETTDRILTLSTCVGNVSRRRVVHARLPMIQAEMKTDSPQAENLQ